MLNIHELANAITAMSNDPMKLIKLQKLCFYCQAWNCAVYKRELVDEPFYALANGPDSLTLRSEYFENNDYMVHPSSSVDIRLDATDQAVVAAVFDYYGGKSGEVLSKLVHTEGPWIKAYGASMYHKKSQPISMGDMQAFYSRHPLFDYFLIELTGEYAYKRLVIEANDFRIENMSMNEMRVAAPLVHELKELSRNDKPPIKSVVQAETAYTFLLADKNIIQVSIDEIRAYFRVKNNNLPTNEKIAAMENVRKMIKNKQLNPTWDINTKGTTEGHYFAYTLPELGIMVNEKTQDAAINSAIDMLFYLHAYYNERTCKSQDQKEKEAVELAYNAYIHDKQALLSLLDLNKRIQTQGEEINAN